MQFFQTNDALKPNGHYSQAIEHNGTVYCSGILPFDRTTGAFVNGDIDAVQGGVPKPGSDFAGKRNVQGARHQNNGIYTGYWLVGAGGRPL